MTAVGLRERKKQETRREIARVALALALERGPQSVTVDQIAAAADVSPRTVHNYFRTRDEAILGVDPERRAELCTEVLMRPARESPIDAMAAVLIDAITGTSNVGQVWRDRARLINEHAELRAAQAAQQTALEAELTAVVAQRTQIPVDHPYPHAVVAATLAVLRVVLEHSGADQPDELRADLVAAFRALATGLRPPKQP